MKQDLWTLAEEPPKMAVSLRMEREGETDSLNWHCRLGHPSEKQTKQMVAQNIAPKQAYTITKNKCTTCMTTYPGRRPIPKVAERNEERTIQVDCMPKMKLLNLSQRRQKYRLGQRLPR